MTCRGFLFDLDGTLVHSLSAVDRAWETWCRRHGLDPLVILPQIHGRRAEDTLRVVAPHLDLSAMMHELETIEATDTEGVVPVLGAPEFLRSLPPAAWGIVTSGTPPVALARIRAGGLPSPSVLVCGNEVAHGKPAPDPFLLGASRLGFSPADCLAFEDAVPGFASASAAGMSVVQIGGVRAELASFWVPDFADVRVSLIDRGFEVLLGN